MKELSLDARVENIERVTDFVNEALEEMGCPIKTQMQIDVAIDELFCNISSYAYAPGTGSATVRFEADPDGHGITLSFIDSGVPYNPLEAPDPDVTLSAAERKIGGLGIFVVKKTMDSVQYRFENGQNILTIEKKW